MVCTLRKTMWITGGLTPAGHIKIGSRLQNILISLTLFLVCIILSSGKIHWYKQTMRGNEKVFLLGWQNNHK